jgi:hypothetical protein
VLGHLGCAPDQPGSADLDTFDAAFSHHAAYVFNMVFELFGSLFCGDEESWRILERLTEAEVGRVSPLSGSLSLYGLLVEDLFSQRGVGSQNGLP